MAQHSHEGTPQELAAYLAQHPNQRFRLIEISPEDEETDENDSVFGGKNLAEMIEEVGTVKGLPADLSTNPVYMRGFGETKTRTLKP